MTHAEGITKFCAHCGESFVMPIRKGGQNQRFCSVQCKEKSRPSRSNAAACIDCGVAIHKGSPRCRSCASRLSNAARPKPTIEERVALFWSHVDKSGECWIWTGARLDSGYGIFGNGIYGESQLAHRISWRLTYGPIPDGLQPCHDCPGGDNPSCVRPEHLFLGTQLDNIQDARRKGRLAQGERSPHAKLSESDVLEIRRLYAAGEHTQKVLARIYGVSPSTIQLIVRRKNWSHLP